MEVRGHSAAKPGRVWPYTICLVLAAVMLTAVNLLAGGCPRRAGDTLRHPVQLPIDWPLPQLKAPPGMEADVVPSAYRTSDRPYQATASGGGRDQWWLVAFDGPRNWGEVDDYARGVLAPLGFRLADVNDKTGVGSHSTYSEYTSADGKVTVRVGYEKSPGTVAYGSYDCYYYLVTVSR